MLVKVQDLKPGNIVRTATRQLIKLEAVNVFEEAKAPLMGPDGRQAYLPGCVLVRWGSAQGNPQSYTFAIDETVERVFSAE